MATTAIDLLAPVHRITVIRQLPESQMLGPQIPVRMAEFRSAPEDLLVA